MSNSRREYFSWDKPVLERQLLSKTSLTVWTRRKPWVPAWVSTVTPILRVFNSFLSHMSTRELEDHSDLHQESHLSTLWMTWTCLILISTTLNLQSAWLDRLLTTDSFITDLNLKKRSSSLTLCSLLAWTPSKVLSKSILDLPDTWPYSPSPPQKKKFWTLFTTRFWKIIFKTLMLTRKSWLQRS